MDAPQYVHVDESPDVVFARMFYYTHNRDKHIPLYVSPDAVS